LQHDASHVESDLDAGGRGDPGAAGGEFEIESEIAAGGAGLMHLDGDDIEPFAECGGTDGAFVPGLFAITGELTLGELGGGDWTVGEPEADDLGSVEVDDGAVVPLESADQIGHRAGFGQIKGVAEPGGDEFLGGIRAET
jgi:hypothetical protein